MRRYRLLVDWEVVDWEVVEQLNALPVSVRRRIRKALEQLAGTPDTLSDYREPNPRGIDLDVHLCAGYAIKY